MIDVSRIDPRLPWFAAVPDSEAGAAVVDRLRRVRGLRFVTHPSGRPWLAGRWSAEEAVLDRREPGDLISRVTSDSALLRDVVDVSVVGGGSGVLLLIGVVTLMGVADLAVGGAQVAAGALDLAGVVAFLLSVLMLIQAMPPPCCCSMKPPPSSTRPCW
ncbi:hypothetical protein AB0M36_14685 [Actinoplanes sp. NPDC051346]|uniref:hypothetical protein n=1 Tax=Actinoplanes sp. NPDC051346 TaxID=3155048 RepID=UPI003417D882